jgi:hypothetical protein
MVSEQQAALIVHPSTPTTGVRSLRARVSAATPGLLKFLYALDADLARLRVPPAGGGRRIDALWKHTCFEAFVATADAAGYHEFNFSPSGDWAAYRFLAYRTGMTPAQLAAPPQINVQRDEHGLQLDCSVAWPPDGGPPASVKIALSAVIESDDGRLAYWAVRHAPDKPDFHHPDAFALELAP